MDVALDRMPTEVRAVWTHAIQQSGFVFVVNIIQSLACHDIVDFCHMFFMSFRKIRSTFSVLSARSLDTGSILEISGPPQRSRK